MTYEVRTHDGQKVAFDELALFFNNNTILHGWKALKDGQTKAEVLEALQAVGFDEVFAEAFVKKMVGNGNMLFHQGRLMLPDDTR